MTVSSFSARLWRVTDYKAQIDNESSGNDWVKLVSTDGFSFIVRRDVALGSGTLRNMLNSE